MDNMILAVGNVIIYENNIKQYRVIAIVKDEITLCEMNVTNFSLSIIDIKTLLSLVSNGEIRIENDIAIIVDKEKLSDDNRKFFELKKKIMTEVINAYGPSFIELNGKKPKSKIKEILKKYDFPKSTFWKTCTLFFQSGMQDYSLVDAKQFGLNSGKQYTHTKKAGRPTEYSAASGVVLTDEIRSFFEEALKDYKIGRQKSVKDAFDKMNLLCLVSYLRR